ncbi:MAG: peptidyl-prolyl cis-trans isomerase, partial [Altererythrobacter sp.]|nr:peptidyl-prolyl cis-trans isomerase [Altererythrobacter sp.]
VMEAVNDGMSVPDTFLDAVSQYIGQTRDISYVEIDQSTLEEIAAPDDATLKAFFDENQSDYRAPEYRTAQIVRLTPEEIFDQTAVSDGDVRAEYDNNKARYATAERRTIPQLVFASDEEAKAARERILAGGTFDAEVEAAGRTMADVTLGTFEKASAPDTDLGDAAFALASTDDVSDVVAGAFGSRLVRVSEIMPEQVQPFEEAAPEIRRQLALLEAQDILLNVHDGYEDARAGGASLMDAATEQKLEVQTVAAIDRQGMDQDGNPVDLGAEANELIRGIFEADANIENPPIGASGDGFIWYEVTEIIEDRDRTLDEVRQQAVEDWTTAEKNKLLDASAEPVAEALRAGRAPSDVATDNGYRADSKFGLSRETDDPDFGRAGVLEVFGVGPNGVGIATGATGLRRLVFRVDTVANPLGDGEGVPAQQAQNIEAAIRNDLLDQMINRLQLEFPVRINQAAIQNAQIAGR